MIKLLHNLALVQVKNANFFSQIVRRKYFKKHDIGPWSPRRKSERSVLGLSLRQFVGPPNCLANTPRFKVNTCVLRSTLATRVARFFLVQNTKTGKNIPNYRELYQMSIEYNKRPHNGPSVHKIYQHLPLQDPPKFSQIWIFGSKTNHLATLHLRPGLPPKIPFGVNFGGSSCNGRCRYII
jgi:hypothetical protein